MENNKTKYINKFSGNSWFKKDKIHNDINAKRKDENIISEISESSDLIESIVRPDQHKLTAFPSQFYTPGTPIHKFNTLSLETNSLGVCWVEINFGQYLGLNAFAASTTGVNPGVNFGRSNVFISDPNYSGVGQLDGFTQYNQGVTGIGQFIASEVMREGIEMYNAVKAGPASVWYDFTGRLDISSGVVTCGINYTFVNDANDVTAANGLLPDMNYITMKSIEDCPFRKTCSVVESLQACFIPQDQTCLDLKDPTKGNTGVQQRFFLLITGAAPNEKVGQLRIAMNFDGKPNAKYADNISQVYVKSASYEAMKEATEWLINNGNVIRKVQDQGYGMGRFN